MRRIPPGFSFGSHAARSCAHGSLRVQTVEMQNVDALRSELRERFLEPEAKKRGEFGVMRAIVRGDFGEGRLVIRAAVFIAPPRVDRETTRAGFVFRHRLAEGEIAFPAIGPEFHQDPRFQRRHEIVGEMDVTVHAPRPNKRGAKLDDGRSSIFSRRSVMRRMIGWPEDRSQHVRQTANHPAGIRSSPTNYSMGWRESRSGPRRTIRLD